MNTQPTELLTTAEKRAWLASIFRDQSGAFTAADKIKALKADTLLALIEETRTASPENGIKNTETAAGSTTADGKRCADLPAQGPYTVEHLAAHAAWAIYGPFGISCTHYFYGLRYPYTSATARAAAVCECARLNAIFLEKENT